MNRLIFFVVFLLVLSIAGCKRDMTSKGAGQDVAPITVELPNDGGPANLKAIKAYADSVDAILPKLSVKGPVPVPVGADIFQGTAYSGADGAPLLLYCERNGIEQWYYLYNRRITEFRDRRKGEKAVEEQRWYYTFKGPLYGEQLEAKDAKGLKKAKAEEIPLKDMEAYYSHGEVTVRVMEALFGRMPK